MEPINPLIERLLGALKEQQAALLDLNARMNQLDERLENLRLEGLAATQATWLEMSERAGEGKTLLKKLQSSAQSIKQSGLLLLKSRLPDRAARLDGDSAFLGHLSS